MWLIIFEPAVKRMLTGDELSISEIQRKEFVSKKREAIRCLTGRVQKIERSE